MAGYHPGLIRGSRSPPKVAQWPWHGSRPGERSKKHGLFGEAMAQE